ncbi:hypothetical protein ACFXTH_036887 [Malus domestica]
MGLAAIFYRLKTLLLLQYYSVFALTYFLLFHVCRCYPRVDGGCLSISPVLRALISISSACTRSFLLTDPPPLPLCTTSNRIPQPHYKPIWTENT